MPSIPVRLSSSLAARARKVARVEERSLTEQVEHWARLGELVEASISGPGARQLKVVSHDPKLRDRLRAVDTTAATRKAERLVKARGGVRYGVGADGSSIVKRRDGKRRGSRSR